MKIILLQSRYGPYHMARLLAAREHLSPLGIDVYGLQVASSDEYLWEELPANNSDILFTAINNKPYQQLEKRLIKHNILSVLDEINPQIIITNGYIFPEALTAINWCRKKQRGVIVACDSKKNDSKRTWPKEFVKSLILKSCDCAHVSGSLSRNYLMTLGMENSRIFEGYDCIDNDYFASYNVTPSSLPPQTHDRPFFLAVNRFIPRKNILNLLEAYKLYREVAGTNFWKLVLIGDGPEIATIKEWLLRNKIDSVELPGFLQIADIAALYKCASCFIHPALQEQWGLTVNEAMASGLPVLLSNKIGCFPELLDDGENGYSFNPESRDSIFQAMLKMHNFTAERREEMGKYSQKIIANWGLQNFAQELQNAILTTAQLIKNKKRPSLVSNIFWNLIN